MMEIILNKTTVAMAAVLAFSGISAANNPSKPNVIVILADDLGWGDLSCYGASLIETPHIDRLATEGRRFDHAYAPSSVCSPSRYALLAGRYAWRNERHPPIGVLPVNAPLAFAQGEPTLASLFKSNGYETAVIGKWHLGFGEGDIASRFDWSRQTIEPGPLDIGFDYFFGTAANAENQPQKYIENRRFYMPGLDYAMDQIAGDITRKAVEFIERSSDRPFFLYYSSLIPHKPVVPSAAFAGTSDCGPYGDFVQELDSNVGSILDALERQGILDETLIIFTSDNGGVAIDDDSHVSLKELHPSMLLAYHKGHRINGNLRGKKQQIFEGGVRVPFIVRWPGYVPAGTVSNSIVCLTDIFAACADILGVELTDGDAPDSFNVLPLWTGSPETVVRNSLVLKSSIGNYALRNAPWKLILKEKLDPRFNHFQENNDQLYNLEKDPSETTNLWNLYPEEVQKMTYLLHKARKAN